jgi:hypothetical protein
MRSPKAGLKNIHKEQRYTAAFAAGYSIHRYANHSHCLRLHHSWHSGAPNRLLSGIK